MKRDVVMKPIISEIPDDHEQLAQWLEPILVGPDLRSLVSELSAIHPDSPINSNMKSILGSNLESVLQKGLHSLDATSISRLINEPISLLELQERVLTHGGTYWREIVQRQESLHATIERTRTAIKEHVDKPRVATRRPAGRTDSSSRRTMLLSIAAGILLTATVGYALMVWSSSNTTAVASWGWLADDAMPSELTPSEYLNKLSRGAEAWFVKRPRDQAGIENRINEFKQGCEKLIAAEHSNLSADQQSWLKQRLQTCLNDVEQQLAKFDSSDVQPLKIRSSVDNIIRDVIQDLKDQAELA